MSKKKAINARVKGDASKPWDATGGICPECGAPVHMFLDPERAVGGPVGYAALLMHYEKQHTAYSAGKPVGWATPPPPPLHEEFDLDDNGKRKLPGREVSDKWEIPPPAPDEWVPVNTRSLELNLPQDEGVWPPARILTQQSQG